MHLMRSGIGLLMLFLTLLMSGWQWLGIENWLWLRSGIANGEWWRCYSGHFVHLGWVHLLMNVVALWLLAGLFFGVLRAGDWVLAMLVLPPAISAGLWWGVPEVSAYSGLSGVLHGAFTLGAFRMLASASERMTGLACLLLLIVKLLAEQLTGETTMTAVWIGGPVLIQSHQFGAGTGLVLAIFLWVGARAKAALGREAATKLVP